MQFRKIEELSINLRDSQLRQLPDFPRMENLTKLTLNLENSGIIQIGSLSSLTSLHFLSISLKDSARISSLPDLSKLTHLECLDLTLEGSTVTQLPLGFDKLPNLKTLSLHLARSAVRQIPSLDELSKLENLSLDITNTRISHLPNLGLKQTNSEARPKRGFESLALKLPLLNDYELKTLNDLAFIHRIDLDMTNSSNTDLPKLKNITDLHDLTIHVNWSQIKTLPALPELNQLTVRVEGALPANLSPEEAVLLLEPIVQISTLSTLTLYLDDSVVNLPHFGETNHLSAFALHMRRVSVKTLNNLAELKQLKTLSLDMEEAGSLESLPGLAAMTYLRNVSLNLRGTSVHDLSSLSNMVELGNLQLHIGSKITSLPELNLSNMQDIQNMNIDMEGVSTINLAEVGKLFAREITVNRSVGSLAELPATVNKLNLGRLIPIENSGQAVCVQEKYIQ